MSNLDQYAQAWDNLLDEEEYLKERKEELRQKLVATYNETITDEMPYESNPGEVSYTYLGSNGLEYKKVVVIPVIVDIAGLQRDHVDIADQVLEKKIVYELSERKAKKLARKDIDAYRILQKYVKDGKPSVRLFRGKQPKEDE